MLCRHCNAELTLQMVDLGTAPPSNAFRSTPDGVEHYYPLQVLVCTACWLAQTNLDLFKLGYDELFTAEYPYFSSTSPSYVEHARRLVEHMTDMLHLGPDSLTVEVGCNDGYLLQHLETPFIGFEPTKTVNSCKNFKMLRNIRKVFFSENAAKELAQLNIRADWMVCNNVLAHVPDINDFVRGFAMLLKDDGVATFEFPHLLNLIAQNQLDTIYNEHYSYLSLTAVDRIFKENGLDIFDVECIPVHGGSLRVYAQRRDTGCRENTLLVRMILDREEEAGIKTEKFYRDFQCSAENVKNNLLVFLLQAKQLKRTVAAFGAAAKGNTLLNFAGVRSDLVQFVVDDTPSKQGKFLPGSRIPVLKEFPFIPDYVLILPWNWKDDIIKKLSYMGEHGTKFVTAIPKLEIL